MSSPLACTFAAAKVYPLARDNFVFNFSLDIPRAKRSLVRAEEEEGVQSARQAGRHQSRQAGTNAGRQSSRQVSSQAGKALG